MRVEGEAEPRNAGASPGASSTTRPYDTSVGVPEAGFRLWPPEL